MHWILCLIVLVKCWEVSTITTRIEQRAPQVRNFRRQADPAGLAIDWELGLREAVHQALLRDHHTDPALRDHLLDAPLIGRQSGGALFGDIALLARGQLYVTPRGYQFVQEPYPSDCEECHLHNRCHKPHCGYWKSPGHQLLALWTVKRIRHRDPRHGHIFEIEYTISPITPAVNDNILTHNGHFNYNLPGHIFVIKTNPTLNSAYYLNNAPKYQTVPDEQSWYPHQQQQQQPEQEEHYKPGIVLGTSPDGYKQVLHSFPGFFTSYHPYVGLQGQEHTQTTVDPKEYELYKKLIQSLAAKTTPHRFGLTTTGTSSEGPLGALPQSTLVRFPDTITENTLPAGSNSGQAHLVTPVQFPTTTNIFSTDQYTTKSEGTSSTTKPKPITTLHFFTPVDDSTESSKLATSPDGSTATSTTRFVPSSSTITSTQQRSTTQPVEFDLFSNGPTSPLTTREIGTVRTTTINSVPSSSTITATQERSTTQPVEFDLFSNSPTSPLTTRKSGTVRTTTSTKRTTSVAKVFDLLPITPTRTSGTVRTTRRKPTTSTTKRTTLVAKESQEADFDVPPAISVTKPMITTPAPLKDHPTSISDQLPPPDRNTDTTVPYLSSSTKPSTAKTATSQPSTIQTEISATETTSTVTRYQTTKLDGSTHSVEAETQSTTTSTVPGISPDTTQTTATVTIFTKPPPSADSTQFQLGNEITTKLHTVPPDSTIFTQLITQPVPSTQYQTEESTVIVETESQFGTTKLEPIVVADSTTEIVTPSTLETETTKVTNPATGAVIFTSTVSATTIPISTGSTLSKPSTTQSDFLIDLSDHSTEKQDLRKEISDDDIFGHQVTPGTTKPTKSAIKKVIQSDLEEALFGGGKRRAKMIKLTSKLSTNPPKIIYSNFYAASTVPPTTPLTELFTAVAATTKSSQQDGSTKIELSDIDFRPLTDQSFSTSISVQVNNNNKSRSFLNQIKHLPTVKAELSEIAELNGYKIYRAEMPEEPDKNVVPVVPTNNKNSNRADNETETRKVLDDMALRLANHAKIIDYLEKKSTKQPKHTRRRNYAPKVRRKQKKPEV